MYSRLAPHGQDLCARREADAELEDPDLRQARREEVAELVDQHQHAEDEDEQDDRLEGVDEPAHAATGPVGERGAHLAVEGDQVVDVRRLVRLAAEPPDGGLEHARDAQEVKRAVEEAGHCHLVGGDQGGGGAAADPAGIAGDPERREPALVGRAEVEAGSGDQVGRGRPATGGARGA